MCHTEDNMVRKDACAPLVKSRYSMSPAIAVPVAAVAVALLLTWQTRHHVTVSTASSSGVAEPLPAIRLDKAASRCDPLKLGNDICVVGASLFQDGGTVSIEFIDSHGRHLVVALDRSIETDAAEKKQGRTIKRLWWNAAYPGNFGGKRMALTSAEGKHVYDVVNHWHANVSSLPKGQFNDEESLAISYVGLFLRAFRELAAHER